jgi:hypothetical protein
MACLRVRPVITSPGSYGKRGQRKVSAWMSDGWPKLFEDMIVVVGFKENPTVDLDGPFCGNEHRDI